MTDINSALRQVGSTLRKVIPDPDRDGQYYGIHFNYSAPNWAAIPNAVDGAGNPAPAGVVEFTAYSPKRVFYAQYLTGFAVCSDDTNEGAAGYLTKNLLFDMNIYDQKREVWLFDKDMYVNAVTGNAGHPYTFRRGIYFHPNTPITFRINCWEMSNWGGADACLRNASYLLHGFML